MKALISLAAAVSIATSVASIAQAQTKHHWGTASVCETRIFAPPTNLRWVPGGSIRSVVRKPTNVVITRFTGSWNYVAYPFQGWVHDSQIYMDRCDWRMIPSW